MAISPEDFIAGYMRPSSAPAGDDNSPESFVARYMRPQPEPEEEDYGALDYGKDLLTSAAGGIGAVIGTVGDIGGLVTGQPDNAVSELGQSVRNYWGERKSGTLQQAEEDRRLKVEQADGEWAKAGTALWETITSPLLLSSFVAEQLPMMAPIAGVGRGAGLIGGAAAKAAGLSEGAIAKAAGMAATSGALGSAAAMQGADAGRQALDQLRAIPEALWRENQQVKDLMTQGASFEDARDQIALDLSRDASLSSAAISLATNLMIPGASTLERVLAGAPAKAAAAGAGRTIARVAGTGLAESIQEGVEEGGGGFTANLATREVDPSVSPFEGVGEQAGLGAAVGGVFGAVGGYIEKGREDRAERIRKEAEAQAQLVQDIINKRTLDESIFAATGAVAAELLKTKEATAGPSEPITGSTTPQLGTEAFLDAAEAAVARGTLERGAGPRQPIGGPPVSVDEASGIIGRAMAPGIGQSPGTILNTAPGTTEEKPSVTIPSVYRDERRPPPGGPPSGGPPSGPSGGGGIPADMAERVDVLLGSRKGRKSEPVRYSEIRRANGKPFPSSSALRASNQWKRIPETDRDNYDVVPLDTGWIAVRKPTAEELFTRAAEAAVARGTLERGAGPRQPLTPRPMTAEEASTVLSRSALPPLQPPGTLLSTATEGRFITPEAQQASTPETTKPPVETVPRETSSTRPTTQWVHTITRRNGDAFPSEKALRNSGQWKRMSPEEQGYYDIEPKGDGFVARRKPDAPPYVRPKTRNPLTDRTVDLERDSILRIIGKLGGIDKQDLLDDGIDPAAIHGISGKGRQGSMPWARSKGGRRLDDMALYLVEYGILKERDPHQVVELIDRALRGERFGHAQYNERLAREEEEAIALHEEAERLGEALASAGLNEDELRALQEESKDEADYIKRAKSRLDGLPARRDDEGLPEGADEEGAGGGEGPQASSGNVDAAGYSDEDIDGFLNGDYDIPGFDDEAPVSADATNPFGEEDEDLDALFSEQVKGEQEKGKADTSALDALEGLLDEGDEVRSPPAEYGGDPSYLRAQRVLSALSENTRTRNPRELMISLIADLKKKGLTDAQLNQLRPHIIRFVSEKTGVQPKPVDKPESRVDKPVEPVDKPVTAAPKAEKPVEKPEKPVEKPSSEAEVQVSAPVQVPTRVDKPAIPVSSGLIVTQRVSKAGKVYWTVPALPEHKALLDKLGFAQPFSLNGEVIRSYFKGDPTSLLANALAGVTQEAELHPTLGEKETAKILQLAGLSVLSTPEAWVVDGKRTYDLREYIKDAGARWNGKAWAFSKEQFPDNPSGTLAYYLNKAATLEKPDTTTTSNLIEEGDEDALARRERLDAIPDERLTPEQYQELVSEETKALLRKGEKFGIPKDVTNNQIEDVGMARSAYERNKPAFIIGSEAGSGKTFVLGGAIREMRALGQTKFIYVTMNKDLIEQIKKDLAAYGVDDVSFHTYAELSVKSPPDTTDAVLIFDEAHNIKNSEFASRGKTAQEMIGKAKMSIFASATPFENPVEVRYMAATGIFGQKTENEFEDWAEAYGASSRTVKFYDPKWGMERTVKTIYWKGRGHKKDGAAARQWFVKQGILAQRLIKLDPKMVDVSFRRYPVAESWVSLYEQVERVYADAIESSDDETGGEMKRHRENVIKRVLEAAKVPAAIELAKEKLKEGRSVVIFVETKADRHLGRWRRSAFFKDDTLYTYPQMQEMMAEWAMEAGMAKMMGEKPPSRPFAGFIYALAGHYYDAGLDVELPSTADDITAALGEENVAVYTGAITNSAASKNKKAFLSDKKKVLIATMAKGGTGLSLHDTVGNRPTSQININLPWKATGVDQVSGRVARYGLQSKAEIVWLFAQNIAWESDKLAPRVGARMRDMGAIVKGLEVKAAEVLDGNFDFEGDIDVKQEFGEGEIQEPRAEYDVNQPDLFGDPYENAETRPGTTKEQKQLGRDAVADLSRRIGLDSVKRRVDDADRGKVSLLGASLVQNFVAGLPNSLIGGRIRSPADLAALAQVYRDPRFETFRVIYTRSNRVVGEAAYGNRLPGVVSFPHGMRWDILRDLAQFKATGFYMLHNHPSGSAQPSSADIIATESMSRFNPDVRKAFKGHVVVDHNEYAVISPETNVTLQKDESLGSVDFSSEPILKNAVLGQNVTESKDLARIAKTLQQPDRAVIVMTKAGGEARVSLVFSVPKSVLNKKPGWVKAFLRRAGRTAGAGGHRFLILPEGSDSNAPYYRVLVMSGIFTDIISADARYSVRDSGVQGPRFDPIMNPLRSGWRIYENESPYRTVQTQTPEFKRWFGNSKVVDEKGEPLTVYHGTGEDITRFDKWQANFFTKNPEYAGGFADKRNVGNGNIVPAYLKIERPLDATTQEGRRLYERYREFARDEYAHQAPVLQANQHVPFTEADRLFVFLQRIARTEDSAIDGMLVDEGGTKGLSFVPLRPEQIKSATGNRGTFDPTNPDIRFSQGAAPIAAHTEQSLYQKLVSVFGEKFVKRLLATGKFKIVNRADAEQVLGLDTLLSQEDLLSTYSQEDLDKLKAEEAARKKQAEQDEKKRKADEARDEFVLTGSDRPADVGSAKGQGSLFSRTPENAYRKSVLTEERLSRLLREYAVSHEPKATKSYIAWIDPKDFLEATASKSDIEYIRRGSRPLDEEALRDEVQHPFLILNKPPSNTSVKIRGHEGRHRAMALMDAGVEKMPVILRIYDVDWTDNFEPVESRLLTAQGDLRTFAFTTDLVPLNYESEPLIRQKFITEPKLSGERLGRRVVSFSRTGSIRGFYNPANGITYLVADHIPQGFTDQQIKGLMAHEIGIHALKAGRDSKGWQSIISELQRLHSEGYSSVVEAHQRALSANPGAEFLWEETAGYLVEAAPETGIARRILTWFKQQAYKLLGFQFPLSPDDVVVMAQAALRAAPDTLGQQTGTGLAGAFASGQSPVWMSVLKQRFSEQGQKTRPASQWKEWLLANTAKLGIKKDEVEWSGITDYLDARGKDRVSTAEIVEWLDANGVRVEEVVLGTPDLWRGDSLYDAKGVKLATIYAVDDDSETPWRVRMETGESPRDSGYVLKTRAEAVTVAENNYSRWLQEGGSVRQGSETKFTQYQLPGGENYRELLLTLPRQPKIVKQFADGSWAVQGEEGSEVLYGRTREEALGRFNKSRGSSSVFTSSHFDQPNILAHVRFNERTDANGKRVLFLEEIQSDWGQKGKKEGFAKPLPKVEQVGEVKLRAGSWGVVDRDGQFWRAANREEAERMAGITQPKPTGIPSAPFVTETKSWVALALKRMVRYAVDNNFDAIAWTTGEQQADRYDLSKQVDRVLYDEDNFLIVYDLGGRSIFDGTVSPEKLPDIIGKDAADKLLAERELAPDLPAELNGEGLKVGGEGMRAFYDKIVPQVANELLKKFGGERVGRINIQDTENAGRFRIWLPDISDFHYETFRFATDAATFAAGVGGDVVATEPTHLDQPGFPLTNRMRELAGRGLPLFSREQPAQKAIPLSEIEIAETVQVEETGEVYEVRTKADVLLRQLDKRINSAQKLIGCLP